MGKRAKNFLRIGAISLFWIAIWFVAAICVNQELLLPSPTDVIVRLFELVVTTEFWLTAATSLFRIFLGTLFAIVLGAVLAMLSSKTKIVYELLFPIVSVIKSTPVASFIILALIWIGRDYLPSFISVLIVFPVAYTNVYEGIKNISVQLLEVARIYDFSFSKKMLKLYVPSVMPYFIAACKSSLGLAWKAGIAAEVLVRPQISIGNELYESKLYLETTNLFAWTAVVIVLSILLEAVFMNLLKKLGKKYNVKE